MSCTCTTAPASSLGHDLKQQVRQVAAGAHDVARVDEQNLPCPDCELSNVKRLGAFCHQRSGGGPYLHRFGIATNSVSVRLAGMTGDECGISTADLDDAARQEIEESRLAYTWRQRFSVVRIVDRPLVRSALD